MVSLRSTIRWKCGLLRIEGVKFRGQWMCLPKWIWATDDQECCSSFTMYEPRHEISNNVVRATSKTSDQPVHKGRFAGDDGPLIVVFGSSLPSTTFKKLSEFDPFLAKLSWSAHASSTSILWVCEHWRLWQFCKHPHQLSNINIVD